VRKINACTPDDIAHVHVELSRRLGVRFVSAAVPPSLNDMIRSAVQKMFRVEIPPTALLRPFTLIDTIVLPYEPGRSGKHPSAEVRIAVHECTHSLRIRQYPGNSIQWYREYFTNGGFRALEEASAEAAVAALEFWRRGTFPAINLQGYCLSGAELQLAVKAHREHCDDIQRLGRGATFGAESAARTAIDILTAMGVVAE
jgi:hypothetical protein